MTFYGDRYREACDFRLNNKLARNVKNNLKFVENNV